jgi:hypothetical protein
MTVEEARDLRAVLAFFEPPFLCKVLEWQKTQKPMLQPLDNIVDLPDNVVDRYFEAGVFEAVPQAELDDHRKSALEMHLFLSPMPAKRVLRLITHTIAINDYAEAPAGQSLFLSSWNRIQDGVVGYGWTADAMWYYGQFELPVASRKFFAFKTYRGYARLATVSTGQRHTVALAQLTSKFLQRRTSDLMGSQIASTWPRLDTYIDNFRRRESDVSLANKSAEMFMQVAAQYNVTINESLSEIKSSIGKPYEYIGVAYTGDPEVPRVSLTKKTRMKLEQVLQDLSVVDRWSFSLAESIFGLLLFASSVVRLQLAPYYYIFKYFRRRHQQQWPPSREANVWPSIHSLLKEWVEELLASSGADIRVTADVAGTLVTDASLFGRGAIFFASDGTVHYEGAPWPAEVLAKHLAIAELEALAVLEGLRSFVKPGQRVHLVVDNTTVLYSAARGRSSNFWLNKIILQMRPYALVTVRYLASHLNPSDSLSRGLGLQCLTSLPFQPTTSSRTAGTWIGDQHTHPGEPDYPTMASDKNHTHRLETL